MVVVDDDDDDDGHSDEGDQLTRGLENKPRESQSEQWPALIVTSRCIQCCHVRLDREDSRCVLRGRGQDHGS